MVPLSSSSSSLSLPSLLDVRSPSSIRRLLILVLISCWCPTAILADSSSSSPSSSSIFSSIVRQSSKALAATARGSTRVAADLVRPKDVKWEELVGWWRFDIARDDADYNSSDNNIQALTVQITKQGRARFTTANGEEMDLAVEFRPASWPRSAKLKFGTKSLWYECTVQRKLANLEILKLRGRIYAMRRFQGKVQIGTFVGRRRVVVMDGMEEEYEEEEYENNDEEYDGDEYDGDNGDGEEYDGSEDDGNEYDSAEETDGSDCSSTDEELSRHQ